MPNRPFPSPAALTGLAVLAALCRASPVTRVTNSSGTRCSTSASCFVAAGEGGNPVSGVRFDGTGSETTLAPTDDPYFAAPVHWMAG